MSEQKMIIVNEECDFIVKNYEAIQALKECEKRAKERVPRWVRRQLKRILDSKLDNKWRIDETEDKKEYFVHLFDKTYYKNADYNGFGGGSNSAV